MNAKKLTTRQLKNYIAAAEEDADDLREQIRSIGRRTIYRNELNARLENRLLIIKTAERRIKELKNPQL